MEQVILDSSALLALIRQEPGRETVAHHLRTDTCSMSAVNVSEVVAKLAERGTGRVEILALLERFPLAVHSFDAEHAIEAGLLRPLTRAAGLSLGDRACLSLAIELGTPVLTTDRAWASLSLPIEVILVR